MTVTLKEMIFRTAAMLVISVQVCWGSDPPKSYGPSSSSGYYQNNYESEIQRPLAVFTEKPVNVANLVMIPVVQVPSSDLKIIYKPQIDSVSKTEPIIMCKSSSKSFEATPAVLVPLQQPFYLYDERTLIPFPKTVTILHGGYRVSIPVGVVVAPIPAGVLRTGPVLVTTLYAIPVSPVLVPSTIRFVPVTSYPSSSQYSHSAPSSSQYSHTSPSAYSHPSPPVYSHPSPPVYSHPSPPVYSHPSPPVYSHPSPPSKSPTVYSHPSPPSSSSEHSHTYPPSSSSSPGYSQHTYPPSSSSSPGYSQHTYPPSSSSSPEYSHPAAAPPKYSPPAPPENAYYQQHGGDYGGGDSPGGGDPPGKLYSHYTADPAPFHNSKESPLLNQLREEAEKNRLKYPPPPPAYAIQFQAIDAY